MKKEKKEKIKNIWNKIKKPLMIFSIIGNILFLMVIVVGCTNTKRKPVSQVSAVNTIEYNDTYWRFNDSLTFNNIGTGFGQPLVYYVGEQECLFMQVYKSSNVWYVKAQTTYDGRYYGGEITLYSNGVWQDNSYKDLHIIANNYQWEDAGVSDTFVTFLTSNAIQQEPPAPEPEEPAEYPNVQKIHLGDNFIPVVYVTQNGDFTLNGFGGKHTNADTNYLILNGFTFFSNGETFNTIYLQYASIPAVAPFVTQDGQEVIETSNTTFSSYLCCIAMKYQYREDNNILSDVLVMSPRRKICSLEGQSVNCYDVRPPFNVYINENYRDLEIIEDTKSIISGDYLTIQGKSAVELLQVTSNISQDVMGFSNVFNLMSSAFAGLASILGIYILPGITLGLLLFIPLIVVIIISVLKIIKK